MKLTKALPFALMKSYFKNSFVVLFASAFSFISSAQNTCDCIVKVQKDALEAHIGSRNLSPEYKPLQPKANSAYAVHQVVRDSGAFWYLVSNSRDATADHKVCKIKKLPTTFLVPIQFNNADSIPVYKEADRKSGIVHYIRKAALKAGDENDRWFSRCKESFVKIIVFEPAPAGQWSGWLSAENYYHK